VVVGFGWDCRSWTDRDDGGRVPARGSWGRSVLAALRTSTQRSDLDLPAGLCVARPSALVVSWRCLIGIRRVLRRFHPYEAICQRLKEGEAKGPGACGTDASARRNQTVDLQFDLD